MSALFVSIGITLASLFIFGFVKGRIVGYNAWKSALEMTLTGALASGAAFGISRAVGPSESPL